MNPFKTFTLRWWQGAIFKWGLLALGLAAGAWWHDFFAGWLPVLLVIAAACLTYITCVWWKQ